MRLVRWGSEERGCGVGGDIVLLKLLLSSRNGYRWESVMKGMALTTPKLEGVGAKHGGFEETSCYDK